MSYSEEVEARLNIIEEELKAEIEEVNSDDTINGVYTFDCIERNIEKEVDNLVKEYPELLVNEDSKVALYINLLGRFE